jgi:hypothetical protein
MSAHWPWQGMQRYCPRSLIDMLRLLQVAELNRFLVNFERCCSYGYMLIETPPVDEAQRRKLLDNSLAKYREALDGFSEACMDGKMPISYPVRRQIEAFKRRLADVANNIVDHKTVNAQAIQIRQLLLDDLSQHLFICIPAEYRELIEQEEPIFGDSVANVFDKAKRDIEASSRCLALGEWTACVFHSMRVLEYGLRELASLVELPADAMAQENWKNVIDQIEAKIRGMEALPKSAEKSAALKTYSEAALQFRYFKDAWRNYVSHTNEPSDERDASSVWNHVKEFMQQLADEIGE